MTDRYVLVVSHSDRSGLQHAWGPYDTEQDAQRTWAWLSEIGVHGLGEILPLRNGPPPTERQERERQQAQYEGLVGLGLPASTALEIVNGAEGT